MTMNRLDNADANFHTNMIHLFNQAVENGWIDQVVVCGLDGAGKGEITGHLVEQYSLRGINTVLIDFPQYSLKYGKIIKKMLKSKKEFTLEQRMALYALNRLESLYEIIKAGLNSLDDSKNIKIIYDRFSTSNVITAAFYYYNNYFKGMPVEQFKRELEDNMLELEGIDEMINTMLKVDKIFHGLLNINPSEVQVYIPQINAEESMSRLLSDSTREGADNYELLEVQLLADWLYRRVARSGKFNLIIDPQNGGGAKEIAQRAFEKFNHSDNFEQRLEPGKKLKLTLQPSNEPYPIEIQNGMNELLSYFDFDIETYLNEEN